ncbi:MAG: hypothetical protein KGI75_29305 [Rhizobiaceae bacterium]|nr:hypothetical protein [Rhizobiaceae bacterium]
MAQELEAGFTGSPVEKPEGIRKVASDSAAVVKREAQAVATGAVDHPHTASAIVLTVGAVAFGIGYLLGRSSTDTGSHYW